MVNLVGNAVKFTDKGKISVIYTVEDESETHLQIHFVVEDEGIGIPKDKQDMIFAAFSQADGSAIRRHGGTGLGLAISNQLVRLMGGEGIMLKSSAGKGSKFFFSLNLSKGSRLDEEKEKRSAPTRPEMGKLYKILLAEDNPLNIKLASILLTRQGHTVRVAENGKLAVERVKRENFDVILMDVHMPVMDGLTATREIRKWESDHSTTQPLNHLPIIAMTASAMKGDKERCLEAGMNGYISKPIKIKEVGRLIEEVIYRSKMGRLLEEVIYRSKTGVKIKILVAEDEGLIRKIYDNGLHKDVFERRIVSNGKDAMKVYKEWNPDIIVLDFNMPIMNGYSVLKEIREKSKDKDTTIIMVTSLSFKDYVMSCIKLGIQGYIVKPIKVGKVGERVLEYYQKANPLEGKAALDKLRDFRKREKEAGKERAKKAQKDKNKAERKEPEEKSGEKPQRKRVLTKRKNLR
jgi:CheY-like chemotaxis protein